MTKRPLEQLPPREPFGHTGQLDVSGQERTWRVSILSFTIGQESPRWDLARCFEEAAATVDNRFSFKPGRKLLDPLNREVEIVRVEGDEVTVRLVSVPCFIAKHSKFMMRPIRKKTY